MIKVIIWVLVILLFGSLFLDIKKNFILETISYPLLDACLMLGAILGFALFYIFSEGL